MEIKKKQKIVKSLHESIKYGDMVEVEDFTKKFPDDKQACNTRNESALSVALKNHRFENYELLVTNKFQFGSLEDLTKL